MKTTLIFAAAASAAVIKRQAAASDCCFGINISGAQAGFTGSAGSLGELYDGQIRVGPGYSNTTFCYNQAAGTIVDQSGRGCVEIGAPQQYQCDEGKVPSGGITIDSTGVISHNGSSIWYECLVNDQGVYNIYTADTGLATQCQQIKLTTSNGSCAPKVSTVVAPTTIAGPTVTMPGSTVTVSAPAQISTVTAPAPAAQVSTLTIPGAGSVTTVTAQATCPAPAAAQTVTITAPAPAAQTVTVQPSCPAPAAAQTITVTAPAPAAQTVTVTAPAPAAQTVTVTSVQSCGTQTQVQVSTQVVPTTVVSVSNAVSTQVVPTTLTQSGTTVQQTVSVPTTVVSVSNAVSTQVVPTTLTQSQTVQQTVSVPTTVIQSTTAVVTPPAPTTSSTTVVAPTTSSAAPTTSSAAPTPSNVCPENLSGTYTYPHLIVPVNSASPDTAYGTQYFAYVNSVNSTIFNIDVDSAWAGKTCDLIFTIPEKDLLETTDYTYKSTGSFAVSQLNTVATQQTTYSNMGASKNVGTFPIAVGTKTVIASGPCAAGTAQSFEFSSASGLDLTWFNDWNPCPLGVFMTAY